MEAGKASKFRDGDKKELEADGRQFLLARVAGRFYAVDNLCPHMEANLSRGKLKDNVLTCPTHGTKFDIRDGSVLRWLKGFGADGRVSEEFKAERRLKTYNVKVENDTVYIEI
jgi:3-phenylpropionate/trans-cinnamate dioxygenase ferredoxin subunit